MLLKEQRESAVAPERHPRCNFPRYGQTPLLSRTKKTLRADTSSAPPLPTCYGCDMAHILPIARCLGSATAIQKGIIGGAVGFHTACAPRSPTLITQTNATSATTTSKTGNPMRTIADCLASPSSLSDAPRDTANAL